MADDLPVMAFATAAEWERWLDVHHARSPGVWMQIAKRGAPTGSVQYPDALDVALCFGWIDGQKAKGSDEAHWRQRFTPRTARSKWSQINRDKVDALIAAGRMRPAGQAQIDAAKADGRWDAAYPGARTATVPPDLQAALDEVPAAAAAFAALTGANRFAVLYRVHDAKRPETRRRRIEAFVAMLAAGDTPLG